MSIRVDNIVVQYVIYIISLTLLQLEKDAVGALKLLVRQIQDEASVHILQSLLSRTGWGIIVHGDGGTHRYG